MLFLVPGMNETLRINGSARITDDARLLARAARRIGVALRMYVAEHDGAARCAFLRAPRR